MDTLSRSTLDRISFATFVSAAYASASVALFFLAVDSVRGNPLLTPSLLGSIVFLGESASTTAAVRLDMVALYSLLHLAGFVALGLTATLATWRYELVRAQPVLLGAGMLALLTASAALVDLLMFPGLVSAIGPVALTSANVLASSVMVGFVFSAVTADGHTAERAA